MNAKTSKEHPDVREVTRALVSRFGQQTLGNKREPFDELLYIILSSKTPPTRYRVTYRSLKSKFPQADQLARAKPQTIAGVIEVGGLADKKAQQISSIAKYLRKQFGRVTLDPLRRMNDGQAEKLLDSLPGIGKKMARCVLMYSLDRKLFPVDSHCYRISQRLGWTSDSSDLTDRIADKLQEGVPPRLRRDLHVGMVLLGREYCQPQRMYCEACPILEYCPTGRARQGLAPV
jgi:endonuclease-3